MSQYRKLLKSNNDVHANYFWNIIAGLLNASEAVVLSMIITRVTGINDAGILTIAFATSNLFATIGKYGVRNYQVTSSSNISFCSYLYARYSTVVLMIFISILYSVNGICHRSYAVYKAGSILCMCLIFAVEALEDVYAGFCQKINRLDIGSKIFIIRWVGILTVCTLGIFATKNLFITLIMALLVSILIFFFCIVKISKTYILIEGEWQTGKILWECLPLCISNFLNFYLCNAPKYSIDKIMDDESQACFGFIAMPVFVIELLSTFIYQPILVNLSEAWNRGERKSIARSILRQIIIIILISVICIGGAYIVGVPFLSILYATDLANYKRELILMVSGGGGLAIVNFLVTVLIMMRKQLYIIVGYAIIALLSFYMFPKTVQVYQTFGAAILYDIVILLLVTIFGLIVTRELLINNGRKKEDL